MTTTTYPALNIDAKLGEPGPNGRAARAEVWGMFQHMEASGWRPVSIDDGEDVTAVATARDAMELIFNLDFAAVKLADAEGNAHAVVLIPENGEDVISDWTYSNDDHDGFNATLEAYAFR